MGGRRHLRAGRGRHEHTLTSLAHPRCHRGGQARGGRETACTDGRAGTRGRRRGASARRAGRPLPQPALGLRPSHCAAARPRGRARHHPPLRVALRAMAARTCRRGHGARRCPTLREAVCCSTWARTWSTRHCRSTGLRNGSMRRSPRDGAATDDDVFIAVQHSSGVTSHLWASAVAAAPGPSLRVLGARAGYVVEDLDGQEKALRAGHRPDESSFGVEPPRTMGPTLQRRPRRRCRTGAWKLAALLCRAGPSPAWRRAATGGSGGRGHMPRCPGCRS